MEQDTLTKKQTREIRLSFRVSEAEHELITKLAEHNELKVSEYVRKRALGGEIVQPKMSRANMQEVVQILHKIQAELGHQGGNIHQIARYLRLRASQSDFNLSDTQRYLEGQIRGLEGEYERFREGVGRLWQLLGK